MADPSTFALVGAVIFLGFLGSKFFEKTKISEVLILMLVGFLLGPVFNVVDSAALVEFVPFFAGVALIILLFDGGLNLNFHKVLYELAPASWFTLLVFLLTVVFVGTVTHFLLAWDWLVAFMFGAVVGGTSSPIVITLLSNVRANEDVKVMLQLESTLTDALTIVGAMAIVQVIVSNSFDLSTSLNAIAGGFSIAAVIGLIVGAVWINFLRNFQGKFDYMLTIAVAFLLYGAVEFTRGNGGIAVLVFGVVLGNAKQLVQMVTQKIDEKVQLHSDFKGFQQEISFFVRTFFFVYVGLILALEALTFWALLVGAVVTIVSLVARKIITKVLGYAARPEATLITTMMPRGLAAAVLASIPATYGIRVPGFTELVMLVIIGSNIVSTIGILKSERSLALAPKRPSVVSVKKQQKY
ncbi:cation:proton antiporter [Candidatus Micrarchaeota archaeon]|nr:cation:proton antiporter [Candidatus Micrarchaeota archaeon]